jgi:hypothetical protein
MKKTRAPEYRAWENMKRRCFCETNPNYKYYGGRGISVFHGWRADFLSFYSHVGPKHSPNHSLDRIDNDRGYEPGNVRWATKIEQRRNRRKQKEKLYVQICCQTKTLKEWCKIHGAEYYKTKGRLVLGWDALSAFNLKPLQKTAIGILFKHGPNCIKNGLKHHLYW